LVLFICIALQIVLIEIIINNIQIQNVDMQLTISILLSV